MIQMYAGAAVFERTVSSNIPQSYTPGQTVTVGTDGNPLEITMENTGTNSWPAEQGGATGTPSGTCQVSINGSNSLTRRRRPARIMERLARSIMSIRALRTTPLFMPRAGRYPRGTEQLIYTKIVPVVTVYNAPVKTCFPVLSGPCEENGPNINMNGGPGLFPTAHAMMAPICGSPRGNNRQFDPAGYETYANGSP